MNYSNVIVLAALAVIIAVSGCTAKVGDTIYKDGAEIKFFSEACESFPSDNENDAYCADKGLSGSLHKPRESGKMELFPSQSTVCYYYCVDEENYQKQASDEANFRIECTVPSDENPDNHDFILNRYQPYGESELEVNVSYELNTPIKILNVVGKGDFSGEAVLDKTWQTRTAEVAEINLFKGITNTNPNQKITNGIIEVTYEKDKVQKTFTSVCKTTP